MNGIGHNIKIGFPCSDATFESLTAIIKGLRDLPGEHLVVELHGFGNGAEFIQTARAERDYLVEIRYRDRVYRKIVPDSKKCITIFRQVCMFADVPDFGDWKDVTELVTNQED